MFDIIYASSRRTTNGSLTRLWPISLRGRTNVVILLFISFVSLSSLKPVEGVKCHLCLFHLAHCTSPLDCYNQPDTCSNTNFSPLQTQVVDCEFGCEQYVITDATGSVVVWRRGCASERSPKSSYICFSRNIYFLRHEQCWCHKDLCNSSRKEQKSINLSVLIFLSTFIVHHTSKGRKVQR